ncbi:HAD family hydrolase [Haloferula rosea]|uniref:HAD-IA family hydrolase n=1 Tax=Haloferula rosea TaxID=490093 RepID=A0A934VHL5_9BACT|nr:HAD family hydrolase [Haloferula rosea]MBK1828800.1 HAD-IA family hydrolase [Haloferula rosea]
MRAVLFDVYQTLLEATPIPRGDRREAMAEVARKFDLPTQIPLDQAFEEAIRKAHHESLFPHPEVDVREIWQSISPELSDPAGFAAAIEDAVNPTRSVQGAPELIISLHRQGLKLGIVSNAQAYTLPLLERHLGEAASYFKPELSVFSYQHLRAKPDPELFRIAIEPLLLRGIPASEILMVGDSRTNDIEPAKGLGLQAHLIPPAELSIPADLLRL